MHGSFNNTSYRSTLVQAEQRSVPLLAGTRLDFLAAAAAAVTV